MIVLERMDRISAAIGRLAAWLCLLLVLLTFAGVVLRYGFSLSPAKLQDGVVYTHALALALGFAATLQANGHVRVDVFYQRMGRRGRARVDLLGALFLLLPTCAVVFWTSLPYVAASWRNLEGSLDSGGLPGLFLVKTLIPLFALLIALQGLVQAGRALQQLRQGVAS